MYIYKMSTMYIYGVQKDYCIVSLMIIHSATLFLDNHRHITAVPKSQICLCIFFIVIKLGKYQDGYNWGEN